MATTRVPRRGSLQFWPRKRANKFLPSVNWSSLNTNSSKGLKGFIAYKAGMISGFVLDNTPDSMTKGKKIIIPLTILECPKVKIFSVRFYKNGKVMEEVVSKNLDKELRRAVKLGKNETGNIEHVKDFDDVRVIIYSTVASTGIKKTPDLSEVALVGNLDEKMNFIKANLHKEISVSEIFEKGKLIDVRGLTKGKGLVGPVKRFGITLKSHKSEKGQRRPGSLGPWHPLRVTYRTPMAGQLGMFTRVVYNNEIVDIGSGNPNLKNIKNFGDIKTDYLLVRGSVPGVPKRQLLITPSFRETKKQAKKSFQLLELR
ncbi:MAG: 50S ribosomal protein L3 [Candidatus Nanoarchaeia archaeon]|nr:50S ribosomal protein L3 [Candidatus Nanoarchaeia archaeon]